MVVAAFWDCATAPVERLHFAGHHIGSPTPLEAKHNNGVIKIDLIRHVIMSIGNFTMQVRLQERATSVDLICPSRNVAVNPGQFALGHWAAVGWWA